MARRLGHRGTGLNARERGRKPIRHVVEARRECPAAALDLGHGVTTASRKTLTNSATAVSLSATRSPFGPSRNPSPMAFAHSSATESAKRRTLAAAVER
jgi:hypothetical protein